MTAALDILASMRLEDGRRWGDAALPEQWEDARELLTGDVRRHYWIRARGRSKTLDAGACVLAGMVAGDYGPGDELIAAAAGRDQATLVIGKIRGLVDRTEELQGAAEVEVERFKVTAKRTGASLAVISSELASSWGRTPRFLFIDEVANHDNTDAARDYADSLLTALVKRRDSRCLLGTTPSSPNHWAYKLWENALESRLWRCSRAAGPAPWQDPPEVEDERRRLGDSMARRLFDAEWCELDDQLVTLEQVRACVGHAEALDPVASCQYVHGVDLGFARDLSAVATCHAEVRDGRQVLVVDRLRSWRPSKGRQVPLTEVEAYVTEVVHQYGGLIHVDPYMAVPLCERWRSAGFAVKQAKFNVTENSRRAALLLQLIRGGQADLPGDPALLTEIAALRLREGSTPGMYKLVSEGGGPGHHDRATAIMLAAAELMARPTGSFLDTYNVTYCANCRRPVPHGRPCQRCGTIAPERPASGGDGATTPTQAPRVSTWGVAKCENGHPYYPDRGDCPQCSRSTTPGSGPIQVGQVQHPNGTYRQIGSIKVWD